MTLDCQQVAYSRSYTSGCSCRGGACKPTSCSCARDGVGCQVDWENFPCACTSACANPHGRRVFDKDAVQAHYRSTQARLKADERRLEVDRLGARIDDEERARPSSIAEKESSLSRTLAEAALLEPSAYSLRRAWPLRQTPTRRSSITTQLQHYSPPLKAVSNSLLGASSTLNDAAHDYDFRNARQLATRNAAQRYTPPPLTAAAAQRDAAKMPLTSRSTIRQRCASFRRHGAHTRRLFC